MRTSSGSGTRPKSSALAVEVRVPHEGRAFAALASKLGTEGVFVSTFHGVREGASVMVELSLPDGPLLVHGTVARAPLVGAAGFAVVFDDLPPESRARILAAAGLIARATA
jgi:hypothetical protein